MSKHRVQDAGVSQPVKLKADDDQLDGLELAAKDLLRAIESKDIKKIASALRDAFLIVDATPHQEGEHVSSEE